MVCASVPVFWPALRKGLGHIFVTKEVEITREQRVETLDDLELQRSTDSRDDGRGQGISLSRTASDASLRGSGHGRESLSAHDRKMGGRRQANYQERFTLAHVDPLHHLQRNVSVVLARDGQKGKLNKF